MLTIPIQVCPSSAEKTNSKNRSAVRTCVQCWVLVYFRGVLFCVGLVASAIQQFEQELIKIILAAKLGG